MVERDAPLAGLHVVEVANWAAVPCAAALLGELGAEVIKIEPPSGDGMRGLMQPASGDDAHIDHPFQFSNRGKRSVALDLRTADGSGLALDLMAKADVVLLNLVEDRRERMGLTPDAIHARNPSAVIGILTGFGDVGPDRNTPGFDLTSFFARSGLSGSVLGPEGGVPRWRAAQGDHVGGLALFGAVMTALFMRERTGEGSVVSTSLLQAASWSNAFDLTRAAADGRPATPRPRTSSVNVASEAFECADGRWIQLCMAEPVRGWEVLCDVLGRQDLFDDPRFGDVTQRFVHMADLVDVIGDELRRHTSADVLDGVRDRGGAAALVATTAEVVADPQVAALGLLRPVEHEAGAFDVIGSPFNMWAAGATPATPDHDPVAAFGRPGADSRSVLREVLGLSDSQIDELVAVGAVTEGGG
jgi:crotonobetainyl-CoA:carnitine CoA-transferase CaiB-like acyl-CoA transferase